MKLSIIIVNYNVKYFLEQCLCSVRKAIQNIEAEVFVVDNNSSDGSLDYLKPKFPFVQFTINKENVGFSKANNQTLTIAKGKYILFLNPDTIVAEDSFEKCIQFLNSNINAGAVGVKMIDSGGNYLKESKRGFPSPWVSFCKLSGLTSLFPHSKIFAKYYLGNLSEKENQIIDAISGAFLFARKDVLDKTGGFDERFFMYAEDIDLSYRIQKSGYKNYYFSETTIIHFKGESTKKDFHQIKLFYKAMSLFVQKHFSSKKSSVFIILINVAIRIRATLSTIKNLIRTNKPQKKAHSIKIFLAGDFESKEKLKQSLSTNKIIFSETEFGADEFIFCEGETCSFKKIIEIIQDSNKRCNYAFHAEDSNSTVSSTHKKSSGEVFGLYSQ